MYFDQMREVSGRKVFDIVPKEGDKFPEKDLYTGFFFHHTYHGLCVYCHDRKWRKVLID